MSKRFFCITLLMVAIFTTQTSQAARQLKAHYACGGNDYSSADLSLWSDRSFTLKVIYLEDQAHPVDYRGNYGEGPNTYDLSFDRLSHKDIAELFEHSEDSNFIRNSDVYRINKNPKRLYIANCLIEKN